MKRLRVWMRGVIAEATSSGNYDKGAEAYKNEDYATALAEFTPLAEAGYDEAQYNLGMMYANGFGVSKDEAEAVKWYHLAAETGNVRAQFNLGVMYDEGRGVKQDYEEALKWYRLAVKAKNDRAMNNLGEMYLYGKGIPQDGAEALEWFSRSAKAGYIKAKFNIEAIFANKSTPQDTATDKELQKGTDAYQIGDYATALAEFTRLAAAGNVKAQNNIGGIYFDGLGVDVDYAEALKWYRLAAEAGNAEAQHNLGYMYYKSAGVPQDDAEAVKWFRLAAEAGLINAQQKLGLMYFDGRGVEQDIRFAYMWFYLADFLGSKKVKVLSDKIVKQMTPEQLTEAKKMLGQYMAKRLLGNICYKGEIVSEDSTEADIKRGNDAYESGDYATALAIFTALAEAGHTEAEYKLGLMYYYGEGVTKDHEEAAEWISRAASAEFADAQNTLGEMYYEGKGVYVNYEEAVICFGDAAQAGHPEAQWNLGHMYLTGEGIEQNNHRAYIWFGRAAIQGCEMAKKSCSLMDLYMTYSEIAEAQNDLGLMYEDGREVEQDYIIAYRWFSLAAAEGHEEAIEKCNSYKEFMAPGIMSAEKEAAKKMLETL